MREEDIVLWRRGVTVSPSFCHIVHMWSLIDGRNLSLFNYEKEGEFVTVKGIGQKCSAGHIIFFYQVTAISLSPNLFW